MPYPVAGPAPGFQTGPAPGYPSGPNPGYPSHPTSGYPAYPPSANFWFRFPLFRISFHFAIALKLILAF